MGRVECLNSFRADENVVLLGDINVRVCDDEMDDKSGEKLV